MALSQSDIDSLNQMASGLSGASNIPWATLLGFVGQDGQQPAPGTPTLAADEQGGIFANNISQLLGQPTLTAQQAGGFFGPNMGYLSNDPTLQAEQAFGTAVGGPYAGQQTVQQQQTSGLLNNGAGYTQSAGEALGNIQGNSTLAAQQQAANIANANATLYGFGSNASTNPGDYYAVADTNGQLLGYVDRASGAITTTLPGNQATNIANWRPNYGPTGGVTGYTWQGSGPPPGGQTTVAEPYGINPGNTTSITATNYKDAAGMAAAAAQQQASNANAKPTLGEQQLGLDTLKTLASLQGPANAFSQQQVLHGLDSSGLSNAVDALSGTVLPRFQAPQAAPVAASAANMLGAGVGTGPSSWAGAPATAAQGPAATPSGGGTRMYAGGSGPNDPALTGGTTNPVLNPADGGTTVYGGTHIYLPQAGNAANASGTDVGQAYSNALPAPNKIVGPAWQALTNADGTQSDTQKFLLAAYQNAGYSPSDVTNAIGAGLPQFKAPAANPGAGSGLVGASGQLAG